MKVIKVFLMVLSLTIVVMGKPSSNPYSDPSYDKVFIKYGQKYNISPKVLKAIAITESTLNPTAKRYNKNKTIDYSLMQINSIWLKEQIAKKLKITKKTIKLPSKNVELAAAILSRIQKKYGKSLYNISYYHSKTKSKRKKWYKKFIKHYQKTKIRYSYSKIGRKLNKKINLLMLSKNNSLHTTKQTKTSKVSNKDKIIKLFLALNP
jgi:soluble lytic murein transglycosylase-like protein